MSDYYTYRPRLTASQEGALALLRSMDPAASLDAAIAGFHADNARAGAAWWLARHRVIGGAR